MDVTGGAYGYVGGVDAQLSDPDSEDLQWSYGFNAGLGACWLAVCDFAVDGENPLDWTGLW